MTSKEALQETTVMKYYIIYEQLPVKNENYCSTARFSCIVEHEEIAKDFCKKHLGCYYNEVKIEDNKQM